MSEDTLSRIAGWCEAEDDLSLESSTITVAGEPALGIEVEIGEEALVLIHTHTVPHAPHGFTDRAVEMLGRRGSMVTGDVVTGADSTDVHIRYPIYLDGLNRQSFLVGVREVTATVDGLEHLIQGGAEVSDDHPTLETPARPTPPPTQVEPRPAVSAAPRPWAPTHRVPTTGMAAWSSPDPSLAPAANLSPGVQLRVDEQRGAWAAVTGSNGWTGWVDARILQPIGTAPPQAAPSWSTPSATTAAATAGSWATTSRPNRSGGLSIPGIIGGVMVLVSAFLAWGNWTYGKAMDLPFGALWPISKWVTWVDPRIGVVLIVAGAVAILGAVVPGIPTAVRAVAGLAAILMAAGIIAQVITSGFGSDLVDLRFTGVGVALIGGMLIAAPGTRPR